MKKGKIESRQGGIFLREGVPYLLRVRVSRRKSVLNVQFSFENGENKRVAKIKGFPLPLCKDI